MNERTFGPFCSHPLSKLVFNVIIYGDGRARLPNIVMYSSRSTLSGACFSRSLLHLIRVIVNLLKLVPSVPQPRTQVSFLSLHCHLEASKYAHFFLVAIIF